MSTSPLLKPFLYKGLKLSNRIVMAPMTRSMSKHNIPGNDVADYYRRRIEGGTGLIITEGTSIPHKAAQSYPDVPNFFGKEALAGWKKVVDEVHRAGGHIFPQLWHVGSVRQINSKTTSGVDNPSHECCQHKVPGYGPSAIAHPYVPHGEIPHEMTKEDIVEVIQAFAEAAKDAKELGFDGVEIHGAHGYLIDQFFWDRTNHRTDEYGGKTLPERTQFAVEIIKAIRKTVGPDFPIDFRFSQWKLGDYNAKLAKTPEELEAFLKPLSEAGVDIFHCSTRVFSTPEFQGSDLNLAGWTKKLTHKPSITVGSIGIDTDFIKTFETDIQTQATHANIENLNKRLEKGEFDLVAVGRALLGDALWANKITSSQFNTITPFSKEVLGALN